MDPRLGWRTAVLGTFCPTLDSLLVSSEYLASYFDSGILLLLRLGGWCPPGGTPNVDKAILMVLVAEPCLLQCLDALRFRLFGRFRYPVIGSDHVIGVGVDAYLFDQVADEGWREFVMSHETGQGPGLVAGEPLGSLATPLE